MDSVRRRDSLSIPPNEGASFVQDVDISPLVDEPMASPSPIKATDLDEGFDSATAPHARMAKANCSMVQSFVSQMPPPILQLEPVNDDQPVLARDHS